MTRQRPDPNRPRWAILLAGLRKRAGCTQGDLAAACKPCFAEDGKDRTFIAKLERGGVKNPPSQIELYYMVQELLTRLDDQLGDREILKMVVHLVAECYGKHKMREVIGFWLRLETAEAVRLEVADGVRDGIAKELRPLAKWLGIKTVKELCKRPEEEPPDGKEYWELHTRLLESFLVTGSGKDIVQRARRNARLGRLLKGLR